MNPDFWQNRKVFITGHTGFKGAWLCLWLKKMGAQVTGYSLAPESTNSLYHTAQVGLVVEQDITGDVRDGEKLLLALQHSGAEIIFHLAAQSLVRASYTSPVETYATNVMGTVHMLEAVRHAPAVRAAVIITTDKCYENREWIWAYRENEPMGGADPYSSSKGCAELVTAAYRQSFFNSADCAAIASARAGNVIGGGDWAVDRLIPDSIRAFVQQESVQIRHPHAIRPWQHVLEPLSGYLQLAEHLWGAPDQYAQAWNFGPAENDAQPVSWMMTHMISLWGGQASWHTQSSEQNLHEANLLKLDISKAKSLLRWQPTLDLEQALSWTIDWYKAVIQKQISAAHMCLEQITQFEKIMSRLN